MIWCTGKSYDMAQGPSFNTLEENTENVKLAEPETGAKDTVREL